MGTPPKKSDSDEADNDAAAKKPQSDGDADPLKDLQHWIVRRLSKLGLPGLIVLLLAAAWIKWDELEKIPGIGPVAEHIGDQIQDLRPLPRPNTTNFVIAIARLEKDADSSHQELIRTDLEKSPDVELLVLHQMVAVKDSSHPQDALRAGHERARALLKQMHADVMIWGEVVRAGKDPMELHWTVAQESQGLALKKSSERYSPDADENLPPLFWTDMRDVLGMLVASERAKLEGQEGRAVADQLKPFIGRVRTLLQNRDLSSEQKASLLDALGYAQRVYGDQQGDNQSLADSIDSFRQVLQARTRERLPLDWAAAQINLGIALETLGERESDTTHLTQAVAAYQEALKEYTRERVPLKWAAAQNNLGIALETLGEGESDTTHLTQAVAACQEALKEYTRERLPLDWARTQNNLGNALASLGERESDTTHLTQAVAAYQEALKELTRERVPLDWAGTQSHLGDALESLGQRESGTTHLTQAVAAYQESLKERTREHVPLDWAETQNNLGLALASLGERESDTTHLTQAVAAYQEALTERTRERVPLDWAETQSHLGDALQLLGERESGTEQLTQAVTAYEAAIRSYTLAIEAAPASLDLSKLKAARARAQAELGRLRSKPSSLSSKQRH